MRSLRCWHGSAKDDRRSRQRRSVHIRARWCTADPLHTAGATRYWRADGSDGQCQHQRSSVRGVARLAGTSCGGCLDGGGSQSHVYVPTAAGSSRCLAHAGAPGRIGRGVLRHAGPAARGSWSVRRHVVCGHQTTRRNRHSDGARGGAGGRRTGSCSCEYSCSSHSA